MLRLRADEHAYTCVLRTSSGGQYGAKFNTRPGYNTIRLPFNAFRPASTDGVPLQPGKIAMLEARWAGAMSCHQAMFLCKGEDLRFYSHILTSQATLNTSASALSRA